MKVYNRIHPASVALRRHPFSPLFSQLADPFPSRLRARRAEPVAWTPNVEATEVEKEYRLVAELPGFSESDFELTVEDGILILSGARPDPFAAPEEEVTVAGDESDEKESEAKAESRARFERRYRFGEEIDEDGVRATFKNGLLVVTIPKAVEVAPPVRRIEVTSH